jgi:HEAT repeat protein/energy-coupling factor transporter ATP-binding protein EcfA2
MMTEQHPDDQLRVTQPQHASGGPSIHAGRNIIQAGGSSTQLGGDGAGQDQVIGTYYGTPPPVKVTSDQHATSLAAYRQRLLKDTHYMSLAGIPLPRDQAGVRRALQMPLEQVYIRIQAIEQQQARQEREQERDEILKASGGRQLVATLRMMGEYFYRQGQVYAAEKRPEPVDPQDALRQHHRLVILGAPGSGKSTLLRMLTRAAAQQPDGPVPILVRLRDYATYRATASGSLRDFALDQAAQGDAVLRVALEQAPRKCWLVDALDEARGWQGAIMEQVRHLPGDLVLTSRPVGYPGGLESLHHFEVLPLVLDDVDRFLQNWFGVLAARRIAPDEWVAERVAWLKTQLEERPRIQALTRNPLLLTFLVVLAGDDPVHDLPTQRATLYRRYVEELLDSWEAQRRPRSGVDGQPVLHLGQLAGADARQAALHGLYRTGWYLHLAYNDGMPGYQPTAAGMVAYLAPFLQTEWGCAPGEAQSIAKDLLTFWGEAGLLDIWRVAGAEYLAFRHLTFQEYAAAWGLREAYRQNARQAWQFVRPRLHHYAWREPLLLLSTMLEQEHVDDLIRQLIRGVSRYERDLLRDLRLATAMVGEEAPLSPEVERVWLRRIRKVTRATEFHYIVSKIALVLLVLALPVLILLHIEGRIYAEPDLLQLLLHIVGRVAIYVFVLIGLIFVTVRYSHLGPFLSWFRSRWAVENMITELRTGGKQALPALQYVLHTRNGEIQRVAAAALGELGDPAAIPALQQVLRDPRSGGQRSAAAALGELGDPAAIPALLQALHDPERRIRQAAAEALGQLGDPTILLQQVLHDPESDARSTAAWTLGELGDPAAIPALLQALHDPDLYVRRAAAAALGELGDPAAIPALLQALHDPESTVQQGAAAALGQLGDTAALSALQQTLCTSGRWRWWVGTKAAAALGQLGDPAAIPALLQALRDREWRIRQAAAEALGQLGDPAAIPALLQALRDREWRIRQAAAEALGQLGDPAAIPALLQALRDPYAEVRAKAAEALGRLGDPAAIPALQQALRDPYRWVWKEVANTLRQLGIPTTSNWGLWKETATALEWLLGDPTALRQVFHNPDREVHQAAAAALCQLGDLAALPALRQALHTPEEYIERYVGYGVQEGAAETLGDFMTATSDITQVQKTAFRLWWTSNNNHNNNSIFQTALEKAANRLAVLEVQASPGSDPLVSPAPVRHIAWGWALFVVVVLVAALLAVWFLPAGFWQARVVVAVATVISILSGTAGLLGYSLRDLFSRTGG